MSDIPTCATCGGHLQYDAPHGGHTEDCFWITGKPKGKGNYGMGTHIPADDSDSDSNSNSAPDHLTELRYALNAYRSAAKAAEGYTSGMRVENVRDARKRVEKLLWDSRAAIVQLVGLRDNDARDAARYRWLRECHWCDSNIFVVTGGKDRVKLGTNCPSGERLDQTIDEAMSLETKVPDAPQPYQQRVLDAPATGTVERALLALKNAQATADNRVALSPADFAHVRKALECAAGVAPSDDTQRLDWLHSWNDVLLETWFENSRIVHKVSRHGHVVGTGSTLREAIDAARGVAASDGQTIPQDTPIDYRDLLVRYMARVIDAESVDYIEHPGGYTNIPLSPAEVDELNKISVEARKQFNL